MGLQITNNGGESVLTVDVNTQKSTSTSIVVEFSGVNDIYVGTWIVHLWNNDTNGTEELELLGVKEIYLEKGSVSGSVTFSGLTPNTTYYIGVVTGDYSTWGEDSFPFTTAPKSSGVTTHERNGFVWTEDVTQSSAIITIQTHPGGDGIEYPYDFYRIHPDTKEPILIDSGEKVWEIRPESSFSYSFDNLVLNTEYQLSTNIPDLGDIEFTTASSSTNITLKASIVGKNIIRVSFSEDPSGSYDMWAWYIQKVGEDDISGGEWVTSGRWVTYMDLKSNTEYYIWVELVNQESDTFDVIGIYVTTLPAEGLFSWTYAGMKKNDDGTYELVLGEEKGDDGTNGAEYFYLHADEWNELTDSINIARDKKGDLPIEFDAAVSGADFTAAMYNEALDYIYYLTNETASDDIRAIKGGNVTPEKLNHLKDKLNAFLES